MSIELTGMTAASAVLHWLVRQMGVMACTPSRWLTALFSKPSAQVRMIRAQRQGLRGLWPGR
jgi:hypothetical protein